MSAKKRIDYTIFNIKLAILISSDTSRYHVQNVLTQRKTRQIHVSSEISNLKKVLYLEWK